MNELREINSQRDEIKRSQRRGPDGLLYPILSLCCYYAESERVHRSCLQALCACPCHADKPHPDKATGEAR